MHAYFWDRLYGHQTPLYFADWNLQYEQWSAINSCAIGAHAFDANMHSNTIDSLLYNKDVHYAVRPDGVTSHSCTLHSLRHAK